MEKIYTTRQTRLSQTTADDVFQLFMNCVTESFDPHTQYFPPRVSEDFDIHMRLSLEGIGAVLQTEYEYTKVVSLVPKGPADKSGLLMPGDRIIGVGQGKDGEIKDIIGLRIDEVVKQIRGQKNTHVRLKIIPAKKSDVTRVVQIKRDTVKLEEQSAKKQVKTVVSGTGSYKVGIIEIPNFYIDFEAYHRGDLQFKSTTSDVKKLLFELAKENIDGLIIDLRDNGGGSLKEASDLTGLFLKTGPTVQIRTKQQMTRLYDEDPEIQYTGPLLVLINRMSASASEIFAGAIKDYHRGIIVGTQSFGKGTVQELKPLGDGKLKLTSAKFYRVSGKSTQHRGVLPHISFPKIYKPDETGESSLDGALPWDTIPSIPFQAYPTLTQLYEPLALAFQKRRETDPGMIYLEKRLALAIQQQTRHRLPLDIDVRQQQRQQFQQAEIQIENNYLASQGNPPVQTPGRGAYGSQPLQGHFVAAGSVDPGGPYRSGKPERVCLVVKRFVLYSVATFIVLGLTGFLFLEPIINSPPVKSRMVSLIEKQIGTRIDSDQLTFLVKPQPGIQVGHLAFPLTRDIGLSVEAIHLDLDLQALLKKKYGCRGSL